MVWRKLRTKVVLGLNILSAMSVKNLSLSMRLLTSSFNFSLILIVFLVVV